MNPVPPVVPVSDLRNKYPHVAEMLKDGPVILSQRSKASAVLVSIEDWNRQAQRLAELERLEVIRQRVRGSDYEPDEDISVEMFMSTLEARDAQDAE